MEAKVLCFILGLLVLSTFVVASESVMHGSCRGGQGCKRIFRVSRLLKHVYFFSLFGTISHIYLMNASVNFYFSYHINFSLLSYMSCRSVAQRINKETRRQKSILVPDFFYLQCLQWGDAMCLIL